MAAKNFISKSAKKLLSRRTYTVLAANKEGVWSPDNIVTSPFKDVELPNKTIVNYIWEKIDKWPNKVAVVCGVTNKSFTYEQLHKYSRNFATRLRSHFQIQSGDVVCAMMANNPEYCIAVLGTLEAGAQLTTVNPNYTAYELNRQLLLSTPKIIIGSTETAKVIKDALKLANIDLPLIIVKTNDESLPLGTVNFEEIATGNVDHGILKEVNCDSEDVALLPYSSGTTGMPKGVELTNKSVTANLAQTDGLFYFKEAIGSFQDVTLGVLPFYHIYGLSVIMLHRLSLGAKIVTLPKFQPNIFLNTVKKHRISVLPVVPPIILFLGSHPDAKKEHLESVHSVTCGAAPLPKNDIDKLLEKSSPDMNFSQLYGLTETSPLVTLEPPGSNNYSVAGCALPNTELKVIGEDQRALGPDQIGELLVRGPQVMKGYRNNMEATRNCIDEDGWLHSGDLAAITKDGSLVIHDRLKELIKVKGFQVPPAELEFVLKEHPSILDAAVLGVPDPRQGESPRAFVVLKEEQKVDPNDIMNFVKERVAEYKRLKDVVFIDSVPRNPSGKILKRVLKEKYC